MGHWIIRAIATLIIWTIVTTASHSSDKSSVIAPITAFPKTFSLGPISLANPTVAATLQVLRPALSDNPVLSSNDIPRQDVIYTRTLEIKPGDTLMPKLVKAGIPRNEAYAAISALSTLYNPSHIQPGQPLSITFREPAGDPASVAGNQKIHTFEGLTLEVDFTKQVAVFRRDAGGFAASEIEIELIHEISGAAGTIDSSLYEAAVKAGVPVSILVEMIHAFSWDVDFQRDIRPNDSFEVMYEQFSNTDGKSVNYGKVMFASLSLSGKRKSIYLHTTKDDGIEDYFDAGGQSVRTALLRTPIDGARLSSRFGKRRHPILGYTRMHKGIDFAAPSGTPIYAAGDGTVEVAGTNKGYGRYVRIRHNSEFETAYAHLNGYGKGIKSGARVLQGQVIGYVGMSGLSTGPHLHYEILRKGAQVNPLSVRMPSGRKLKGSELKRFSTLRAHIDSQWKEINPSGGGNPL
jgi:murein DD-endopeptidase MepM/ murein hydrolase activator NlpD